MYYIEIHPEIYRILNVFNKIGMWKTEEETVFGRMGRKFFFLSKMVCLLISFLYTGFQSPERNEFIHFISMAITLVVVIVKCIYILSKQDEILKLVEVISVHSFEDAAEYTRVKIKLDNLMKFSRAFAVLICLGVIIPSAVPLFAIEKVLPLNIDLPLNWRNSKLCYGVSYTLIICSGLICLVSSLLMIIVWYLMINSSIKYESLGNRLKSMGAVGSTKMVDEKTAISGAELLHEKLKLQAERQKLFHDEFIQLIEQHRVIRESIDDVKSLFANLFLTQIVTSGICICSSIYALAFSDNDDLLQSAIHVVIISYNFFDIFMTMFLGNEISVASDRLSYCLFESNWIDQSPACKKCIIIFGEMLMQPHQLVIGKLYPMNLVTFTSILDFAYSSFNILKSFR